MCPWVTTTASIAVDGSPSSSSRARSCRCCAGSPASTSTAAPPSTTSHQFTSASPSRYVPGTTSRRTGAVIRR